ncbi:T6SS amidase immunity protein Tai4 family protein [Franconibacter pulveris]|uniref:Type VI secretion protein n=1 Tax=Franconibacter pulveris TaxID=435910 RepID=A0A0J8VI43_9ENTR|nr:T6SS amidase immunity protein Tai4 family protein [Franconibacter pulveris]KMV32871.1 hypothetical protein ACH50_19240 [Franconibacter pulveris]
MKKDIFALLFICNSAFAGATSDPVAFIKDKPYIQVVKDIVLARCLAQIAEPYSTFSLDAAHTSNALREWVPFDIDNGDKKINDLIDQFKGAVNYSYSDRSKDNKGLTLNCLRLYHSPELDKVAKAVLLENPDRTWNQDNPQ